MSPSTGGANAAGDSSGAGGSSAGKANGGAGQGGSAGQPELEPDCVEGIPATPQLRRLSHAHYDRTLRDLLRVTEVDGAPPSALLATDSQSDMLSELEWEAYRAAAAKIAALVVGDQALRPSFLGCTPSDAADACWRETITAFGRRAFRRPLTPQEVADFEALVAATAAVPETSTVDALAEALLTAFLTSPSFLLRAELAGTPDGQERFLLSPHELASRLSYLVWGSLPDAELDAAADAGALVTKEEVLAQAERMLADDRARDRVAEFHRFYLRMLPSSHWLATRDKDRTVFPLFTTGVATAMLEEVERFFDAITFEERGSFQDFLASTRGFVNADTAPIYGLDPTDFGSELSAVSLDPVQRRGFLTRIGFLATHSSYDRTSPILRGLFVSKHVLGLDIPPPIPTPAPPLPGGEYLTNRERVQALTSETGCRECHETYINPPGFVLENYDSIGAWQTEERATGAPIDPVAGVLIDDAVVTVTDSADLMRRIADSRGARRTYAGSWVSFAYERPLDPLDECTVERLTYAIGTGSYPILELIRDLTQTDAFRLRATN